MIRTISTGLLSALLAVWLPATPARADLYTDTAMSLEWIVDSADGFFIARVVEIDKHRRVLAVRLESRILKKGQRPSDWTFPSPSTWKASLSGSKPGDEWLLAIRGRGAATRVFRGINLTEPMQSYRWAAITMAGGTAKVLETRDAILQAVRRRIERDRKLPGHCDRDLVDICASRSAGTAPPGASFVGGYPLPVDVMYWDEEAPRRSRLDTMLTALIVPASHPRPAKVKKLPKHVSDSGESHSRRDFEGYSREMLKAGMFPTLGRPARELVGDWKLIRTDTVVHLTLHPESTFLAEVTARSGKSLEPLSFYGGRRKEPGPGLGSGVWSFDGKWLTIRLTAILSEGRWSGPGSAMLYRGQLKEAVPRRIGFVDGSTMARAATPVETYRYHQNGQWRSLVR